MKISEKRLLAMISLVVSGMLVPSLNAQWGPKIYIQPQEGFDSYISAAIVKKHVPVVVTQNIDDAELVLTSSVKSKEESTGSKIARCLFVYCMGIGGVQTATVQLVNAKGEVVWAYNVIKGDANRYQSTAEAIAKHLKEFLEKGYRQ